MNDQYEKRYELSIIFIVGLANIYFPQIVILLKGIGNIGIIPESLQLKMQSIIENPIFPMDARLQGIYAHTRFNCYQTRLN